LEKGEEGGRVYEIVPAIVFQKKHKRGKMRGERSMEVGERHPGGNYRSHYFDSRRETLEKGRRK